MNFFALLPVAVIAAAPAVASAQDSQSTNGDIVWIGLANNSDSEVTMATEVRDLIRTYDVSPWILTRKILIDGQQIPHSHPVLTIHTRHIGEELELLSTFVHEQLHWLEEEPWLENFEAAMNDYERLFPEVPSSANGGARDEQSTYRHLLVCDLELQALTTLVGQKLARETLGQITHYEWIYNKVLNDARIRDVSISHGFDLSQGVPSR